MIFYYIVIQYDIVSCDTILYQINMILYHIIIASYYDVTVSYYDIVSHYTKLYHMIYHLVIL